MLTYDEKTLQLEEKPENDIFQKTIRQYRNDDTKDTGSFKIYLFIIYLFIFSLEKIIEISLIRL